MRRYWALGRREWQEHRGTLLWLPVFVTALLAVTATLTALLSPAWMTEQVDSGASMNGPQLRHLLLMTARPLLTLWFLTTVFYLLGTLFDERRDRTILFWKSLPVSDSEAVLAKLSVALLVTPAVAFVCITLLQLSATALIAAFCPCEVLLRSSIWTEAQLVSTLLHWVVALLTQTVWWLPLWGWLLLVSVAAPRLPVIWALLVPLLTALLERLAFGSSWLYRALERRLDTPALPDYGRSAAGDSVQTIALGDTLSLWLSVELWLGALLGVGLLLLTVRLRRRLNEL